MKEDKAEITEILSSIQGEGIFLGARQVFVRFKGCNMSCVFCDEDKDARASEYTPLELLAEVKRLEASRGPHHSVSVTGGEPLLYADFLKSFLKFLKEAGFKTYLETNGTLPRALRCVIGLVDIVAMDLKLPSSTQERPFWKEHKDFLKIALRKKVFVKVIVTSATKADDIEKAMRLVKSAGDKIPFIIQPATPVYSTDKPVARESLMRFLEIGSKRRLENIRIIPQIHKMLNVP